MTTNHTQTNEDTVQSVVGKKFPTKGIKLSTDDVKNPRYQCHSSLVPIYPVRYGLTKNYLDNVRDENNPVVGPLTMPKSLTEKNGIYELQQLRQGYIYIYAHTEHRGQSTDKKGKWMVFRYDTNPHDTNGKDQLSYVQTISNTTKPSFFLYSWEDNGAEGRNWDKADVREYDTVFVEEDVQFIDIAYSEYTWSEQLFDELEKNKTKREIIMRTVDIEQHDVITPHTAPFEKLDELVLEFIDKADLKRDLQEESKDWHTCHINDKKERINLSGKKGLIVALEDTAGEMKELQKCHYEHAERRQKYLAEHVYPLTIGNIIHPKKAYELRGIDYPTKDAKSLFEQKDIKDVLCEGFDDLYGNLVNQTIKKHENPINELIKLVTELTKRESYKTLIKMIESAIEKNSSSADLIRSTYVLFSTLADIFYTFEASPEGESAIATLYGAKAKINAPDLSIFSAVVSKALIAVDQVTDKGNKNLFKPFYIGIESFLYNSGRTMVKWSIVEIAKELATPPGQHAKKLPPKLVPKGTLKILFKIFNLGMEENPKLFLNKLNIEIRESVGEFKTPGMSRKKFHFRRGKGDKAQILKGLDRATEAFLDPLNNKMEVAFNEIKPYKAILGVVGIFAGFLSLNSDRTTARALATTKSGKWANNNALNSTTEILNITAACWDTAQTSASVRSLGARSLEARTLGRRLGAKELLPMGMIGVQIIAGVLTAAISAVNFVEAMKNEDAVAQWSHASIGVVSLGYSFVSAGSLAGAVEVGFALGPMGVVAGVIIFIAIIALCLFSNSAWATWVKTGFWGNSKAYWLWDLETREELSIQLKHAKILADTKAADASIPIAAKLKVFDDRLVQLDKKYAEQYRQFSSYRTMPSTYSLPSQYGAFPPHVRERVAISQEKTAYLNQQKEDSKGEKALRYLRISHGFNEELYRLGILSGLRVEKIDDFIRITFTGFIKTSPTQNNLNIICQVDGVLVTAATLQINKAHITKNTVVFGFSEFGIKGDSYRIVVNFTDSSGDKFKGSYVNEQFVKDRAKVLQYQKSYQYYM